jgi:hypothetical protein
MNRRNEASLAMAKRCYSMLGYAVELEYSGKATTLECAGTGAELRRRGGVFWD